MNSREMLFGDAFNDFMILPQVGMHGLMKSDVYLHSNKYVIEVDMPGFKKEDVTMDYENGYLNITAKTVNKIEEKEYIRRERYFGEYKRSYYVGNIDENLITAHFENGTLKVYLPKPEDEVPAKKTIEIK